MNNNSSSSNNSALKFLISFAEQLSIYGATVHEIEETIFSLKDALNLKGDIVLFNNVLLTSLSETNTPQVTLTRFKYQKVNINRLAMLEKLFLDIHSHQISLEDGWVRLENIKQAKQLYNNILEFISWPLVSAGFVIILHGSWREIIVSCLISIIIFTVNSILSKNDTGTGVRIIIPISAFIAAFLSVITYSYISPISISITTISSLMKFMPGFYLTQSMTEIAFRRPITGMAHLCDAIMILVILAMGVFLGTAIGSLIAPLPMGKSLPIPSNQMLCLAGLCVGWSFVFTYNISKKFILPVIVSSIIIILIWIHCKEIYGTVYGTGLAATIGAVIANLFARISKSSDLIIKIPTAIIIVPGIFGLRALIEIINYGAIFGIDNFLTTFALGVSIAGGFLFADIVIPPSVHPGKVKSYSTPWLINLFKKINPK